MKDYTKRALRTFVQDFLGTVSFIGLFSAIAETGVLPGWNVFAAIGLMAAASGVTGVISYTQNWLEDTKQLKVMVK